MSRGRERNTPPGIRLLHACRGRKLGYDAVKISVLVLTFLCYGAYHAARKPPSIVKSVLRGEQKRLNAPLVETDGEAVLGWEPFNQENGQSLLGEVDLAFLASYALGMFFAGHIGDRTDLRLFLTVGMLGSGLFVVLFGMGYFWKIHSLSYYIIVQILAGVFQATGWPSVVSIMANWYGKGKRGLIMGIWNAHTSLGNILGTVIASSCLVYGWGWAFVLPGLIIAALGLLMYGFLTVQPSDAGVQPPYELVKSSDGMQDARDEKSDRDAEALGFMEAWRIPGVTAFALCLFFSKLIAYTFLYWLPYYIKSTPIEGRILTPKEAGDLSVLFDVGGVAGGVLAGHLSDKTGANALVATSFTLCSVPFLYLYRYYGHLSFELNIALMMLSGFFVNGPYALITTAVSADLGTHESLHGNAKALATVTAIIDGMGSIGAAIGPMLTGYISERGGFDGVFMMLYGAATAAGVLLVRLALKEWQTIVADRRRSLAPVGLQMTQR